MSQWPQDGIKFLQRSWEARCSSENRGPWKSRSQGASRVTRPGNALYTDIFKLSTPRLTFLEKTCSAWVPGEKACTQLFGSVPAVDIWDLLSSKPPLFEDCWYLSGFRKKGGKKLKTKENKVTGNKRNCRTWTCADKETLPSHIQWRFPSQ